MSGGGLGTAPLGWDEKKPRNSIKLPLFSRSHSNWRRFLSPPHAIIGSDRFRFPVASQIAFPIAGAIATIGARFNRLPIDQYRARRALPFAAAELGTREIEVVAQNAE
jgi:hypothetical protein